jgi:RimJ/RimL family protein N-acetyltransferase
MTAPTLHTARLTLRPPRMEDFPAYRTFLMSDRARYMGGPHDAPMAWNWFCNDTAQWPLLGMGALMITEGGAAIGQVAVCHGPIFPEPELGWFLYGGHEGVGYATEAATAMRDWAFGTRGLTTLVSYVDPVNAASARVALRLGAVIDPAAATPDNDPCTVYRHLAGGRA